MNFDQAFKQLIGNEGGYSDNPADPGGETMWGITARVARAHGYTGPMRDLPLDTAKAIAKAEYWNPFKCDQLPPAVRFQVLDAAYNGGHPAQWLQRAAGVTVDGDIGPVTLAALAKADPDKITMRFDAYRLQYLGSLRGELPAFAAGWMDRIANNLIVGASDAA